jgi:hypothetical protein
MIFFNYDSFEIVAIAFIVTGILIQSLYISSATPNNESLINTLSKSDISIQSNNLDTTQLIDASVQTEANIQVEASIQAVNTYVNTGMQTSARMWLESIRNWITEILGTPTTPQATGQYVDVGIQTQTKTTWQMVKDWFKDTFSANSSDLTFLDHTKVENWKNNLNHSQITPSSEVISEISPLNLQSSIGPDESASNVSEVVSESNLLNVVDRVYDITDPATLTNLMEDPTVYSYFDIVDNTYYVISNAVLTVDPSIVNLLSIVN